MLYTAKFIYQKKMYKMVFKALRLYHTQKVIFLSRIFFIGSRKIEIY